VPGRSSLRTVDACDSAGAVLGCHSVDSCCGKVMLEDWSQCSNCTVLEVSGRAAWRLGVFLVSDRAMTDASVSQNSIFILWAREGAGPGRLANERLIFIYEC
jgi:hypothetical protein